MSESFTPKNNCPYPQADCFFDQKCWGDCKEKKHQPINKRVSDLEQEVFKLRQIIMRLDKK